MPRNSDILSLGNLGPGQIPNGAVEDVSLKNPQRDTLPLIAHVTDPSRAHMAATIGITDAGGFYASDEVEGALQELGGTSSGSRQNGVLTGFGFTSSGLDITFDSPSTAAVPTVRDYSGDTISLPDNTPSIWVYIDPSTATLEQFVGASPPSITSPENVLLWNITTLGGVVTLYRDARIYVTSLDRKLPYTVRSAGTQKDQESEACFVTLDAALTYLTHSSSLGLLRTEIVIRGAVDLVGPVALPVAGVHFRGEDSARINLVSGTNLFDLNGQSDITFSDLSFTSDVASSVAIRDLAGGSANFTMERCSIVTGGQPWQAGVQFDSVVGQATLRDVTVFSTDKGISTLNPTGVLVDTCKVVAVGFVGGSIGIQIGFPPVGGLELPSTISSCIVDGFDNSISVSGVGHNVIGCTAATAGNACISVGSGQDIRITNCRLDCLTNSGKIGVFATGSFGSQTTGLKLSGNTVLGATQYGIHLSGFVQESTLQGNLIDCYLPGTPNDPTAEAGIFLEPTSPTDTPSYNEITGNTVWRAKTGIYLTGTPSQKIQEVVISNNIVHHCAVGVVGTPGAFQTSVGIFALWGVGVSICGNSVYGLGGILTPGGVVVQPTLGDVYSEGITLVDCSIGSVQSNQIRNLQVLGAGVSKGVSYNSSGSSAVSISGAVMSGNSIIAVPGTAIYCGIGDSSASGLSGFSGARISENLVSDSSQGISVQSLGRSEVGGLIISGNSISTITVTNGVELISWDTGGAVPDGIIEGVEISGNTILKTTTDGIFARCDAGASLSNVRVVNNTVTPGENGIVLFAKDGGFLPALNFANFQVSGNQIQMDAGVNFTGVYITGVTTGFSGAFVSENDIRDAFVGAKFEFYGPGPSEASTSSIGASRNQILRSRSRGLEVVVLGTLSLSDFEENTLTGQPGSSGGLYFQVAYLAATDNSCQDVRVLGNHVTAPTGAPCVQFSATKVKIQNLSFEGNTLRGGSLGAMFGFSDTNVGPNPGVSGLSFRDNTFILNEFLGLSVSSPNAGEQWNFDFSGNTFDRVSRDLGSPTSSVINFSSGGTLRNLSVRNNQFMSCGNQSGTEGGVTLTLKDSYGVDVSGNQFEGLDTGFPFGVGNSVSLSGAALGPWALRDISVCKNVSRNAFLQWGVFPAHINLDFANFATVHNLSVCDNDIERNRNATFLDNSGVAIIGPSTNFYGLVVTGNRVTGASLLFPIIAIGIMIQGKKLFGGVVSNNFVTGNPITGAQGPGLAVNIPEGIDSLEVQNNRVLGEGGSIGVYVFSDTTYTVVGARIDQNYASGFEYNIWVSAGSFTSLSVSRNVCVDHLVTGVHIISSGVGGVCSNLTVNDNAVSTSTDAQSYGVYLATTASNSLSGVSVCGNSVRYTGGTIAAGSGILLRSGSAATQALVNTQASGNKIETFTDGLLVLSGEVDNVSLDKNQILDVGSSGLHHTITGTSVGFSACGNSIQARKSSTASGLLQIEFGSDGSLFSCAQVCNNNVFGGYTSATGTYGGNNGIFIGDFSNAPAMHTTSISNNTVRLSTTGVVVVAASAQALSFTQNNVDRVSGNGLYFGSGGASLGDFYDVSFSGNTVRSWSEDVAATNYRALAFVVGTTGSNVTRGLTVSGNTITTAQSDAYGYFLDIGTNSSFGVIFSGNSCSYTGGPANTWALYLDFGTGTLKNYSLIGNVFRGSSGGIQQNGVFTVDACTLLGNIGDAAGSWSQFENGGGAGWTSVKPPAGAGAGQFQNLNIDDGT